jgi:hypothetical protein
MGDRDPARPAIPTRGAFALYAALLLSAASAMNVRLTFVVGLPLIVAALVAAWRALRTDAAPSTSAHGVWIGLSMLAALGLVATGTSGGWWFEAARRTYAIAGVLVVGVVAGGDERARRVALRALVGAACLLLAWTPVATPSPMIDVVSWTTAATNALLSGVHPYTVQAADVYNGGRDFGFVVNVYPYMPATLLAYAPWVALLGDFRFALAASAAAAVWLLRRAGRLASASTTTIDAATLALALHPQLFLIVRSGWTEPLLLATAAGCVYLAARYPRRAVSAVALWLLPAFKQYALPPVVLQAALSDRVPRRAIAAGAALVAVTMAPFLLWDAAATLHGTLFQMQAPVHPRLTSMSVPGLLFATGNPFPPIWLSAATELIACAVVVLVAKRRDLADLLIGTSVALLATFLLGWQAFLNYFYFVAGLLALGAMLSDTSVRCRA